MEVYIRSDGSLGVREQAGVAMRATGTPDAIPLYSRGGLFGVCGMHPTLVNACVGPMGVESILTWVGTDEENPIYDALAYIGTSTHAQDGGCDDCGKPVIRECAQTACFGRICQQTNEMQVDELGLRMNRGVPTMALFGDITDPGGNILLGKGQPITDTFVLNAIAAGYNLRMGVGQLLWSGDPANNSAGGGYQEPVGLELIVNTGKFDAITQIACNALDSTLVDYGSNVVGAPGSPSILRHIASVIRSVRYRIAGANIDPETADIRIVLHPNIWECVADAAACEYGISCHANQGMGPQVQHTNDALQVAKVRDNIMQTMQLTIDGRAYPVTLDNLMPYSFGGLYDGDSYFCSDIYVLTLSAGGKTVLWGEYQDFNKTAGRAMAEMRSMVGGSVPIAFTDGGRFALAPTYHGGFCFDVRAITKPRIIAITPQWCGRVQNVCCAPLGEYPDPSGLYGGLYGKDGGAAMKSYLDLYGECWPGTEPAQ